MQAVRASGHAGLDDQLPGGGWPTRGPTELLLLASAGPDRLRVALLKRRGPPLAEPLTLPLPPVLSPLARLRALAVRELPASMVETTA